MGGRPRTVATEESNTTINECGGKLSCKYQEAGLGDDNDRHEWMECMKELGDVSRVITKEPRLTEATRTKRLPRSKVLLNQLKKGQSFSQMKSSSWWTEPYIQGVTATLPE